MTIASGARMANVQVRSSHDDLPARRHESQRAVEEARVPVGLAAGARASRVGRTVEPDRVHRDHRRDDDQQPCDDDEHPAGASGRDRQRIAHDVPLGAAEGRELRRPVVPGREPRAARRAATSSAGNTATCSGYRCSMTSPGNSPPNSTNESHVPTSGMPSAIPSVMRRPVPESRSSGSAYPLHPPARATTKIRNSSTHAHRRGRRNAPVKNVVSELHDDRRRQQQPRPVVGLPQEQPAGQVERDPHRRRERLGDRGAVQRRVSAGVGDRRRSRACRRTSARAP